MSPEPVDSSFEATVVASRDLIQPLALIDFESPELVDLPCPELLARFTPNGTNPILEVCGGTHLNVLVRIVCGGDKRPSPVGNGVCSSLPLPRADRSVITEG